jgi:amicoumacin kinase
MEPIDPKILIEACALFGAAPQDLRHLSGGTYTAVYGCRIDGQECVLRILPAEQESGLAATLDWIAFLAQHGAPVARPVRSLSGKFIEPLGAEKSETIAHVVEKAQGTLAEDLAADTWTDELFAAIGQATGQFHNLSAQYQPGPGAPRRPDWLAENEAYISGEYHQTLPPDLQTLNTHLVAEMLALPRGPLEFGLVHGDLHFANFFIADKHITIFDFDDSCYGWFALDVAMILFDVLVLYPGEDKAVFAQRFLRAFLKGYRCQRRFDSFWVERLPLLLKIQELWIYALLLPDDRDWEPDSWPAKFMPGRKERLQTDLPYVELDFAALDQT